MQLAWLAALSLDGWRWDEKAFVSGLLLALGALAWAFAFTAAEGALRSQRWAFRASGTVLAAVAIYAATRIWF
jgi:hypothetical protein